VLSGAAGPERIVVLANAGAAIYLGGGADSISSGVMKAAETIDSGAAADLLERYVASSAELAPR
nr:anthranilate phosphoribosyltransferase [Thermoleophilaceae bacterium]